MNSSMKIKINNVLITGRVDGVSNFEITLRRDDDAGKTARSFTSELTFYDDGYNIIKTQLIDDVNGFGKKVDVKIYDDCCSVPVFEGYIRGDAIDWCEPACSVTANVVEIDDAYSCLESRVINLKNSALTSDRDWIDVPYCIEHRPKFVQIIISILLALIGNIISFVLFPFFILIVLLSGIFYVLCSIVCFLPLTDCTQDDCDESQLSPTSILATLEDAVNDTIGFFDTCNRKHPSGLLRSYIINTCSLCGLNFQSSILNQPSSIYYNTLLWSAPVEKGILNTLPSGGLIEQNKPIETLQTLFDNVLKPTFNGDYQISGNTLIFERRDFFQSTTTWIDAEQMLNNGNIIDNQICYSWIDRERWAFGRFEYSMDALDIIGNEAKLRFNDIVEWNIPFNVTQSGQYQNILPVAMARFRGDDVDNEGTIFDLLSFYQGGIINVFFSGLFSNDQNQMLLNNHCGFLYKLLIWDGVNMDAGKIVHNFSNSYTGGPVIIDGTTIDADDLFNYPYWFKEGNTNNLYSLFHYIDDPRQPGSTQFNFDFSFPFSCQQLADFDFNKVVRLPKNGAIVYGRVKEVKINFINRTISVSGIV
jgi:hypothetical protein